MIYAEFLKPIAAVFLLFLAGTALEISRDYGVLLADAAMIVAGIVSAMVLIGASVVMMVRR
ncbi:hypothetical protein MCP1_10269 [Candidatus Terasakiella magnetica]|nr:hypothetical protein MCP1_10269 [Candidatus Terasakiella magnetica]